MTSTLTLPPGLMIAAPRSGAGKTTVTLGLLRALAQRGLRVQAFKCGPDYIDPAFHQAASGRPSYNLDSWAMRRSLAADLLEAGCRDSDIVVTESLMGLFDGVATRGQWGTGTSADLAAATGWPVVLVLDVSGQSQTAAATARGFVGFRDGVNIAGVVLNRTGSARHIRLATTALEEAGLPVLGALPRRTDLVLPERHLGLVQAEETPELIERLDGLADFVAENVDVTRVIAAAKPGRFARDASHAARPPGQRIALARDAAFSFVYPHLIAAWRLAGAEIMPFSPLADEAPDATADVVWLPGGYPELYAARLAGCQTFKTSLRRFAETKPVHGECGGYMVLGAGIADANGTRHEMIGLLALETSFAARKIHLGYRSAQLMADCPIGRAGATVRGHEFHYASVALSGDEPLARITDADGNAIAETGSRRGFVSGSFFHLVDG